MQTMILEQRGRDLFRPKPGPLRKMTHLEYFASAYVFAHYSGSYMIKLECGHEVCRKANVVKANRTGYYRCPDCRKEE